MQSPADLSGGLRPPLAKTVPFTNYHLVQWGKPRCDEVVILVKPGKRSWLVKRVTGLPGERVDRGAEAGQIVPADHCVVLGDNRGQSYDSRSFGSVPETSLLGRVVGVAVSFDPGNSHWPRWCRWLARVPEMRGEER